jgi:hypothetical protein
MTPGKKREQGVCQWITADPCENRTMACRVRHDPARERRHDPARRHRRRRERPDDRAAVDRRLHAGAGRRRDVGTSLKVRAIVLPDEHIRLRLTPSISWLADDSSGAIEFTEAATELVVRSGQPVVLGGSTTETHAVTRQILGIGARDAASETSVVLTATTLGR